MTVSLLDVEGRAPNPLYRAVSVAQGSRSIRIAGQVGTDADLQLAGPGLREQTEQAVRNVHAALAAAGATPDDLVAVTIYVTGWRPELMEELVAGLTAVPGTPPVPATLIGVDMLFEPGYLVEIVAEAVAD